MSLMGRREAIDAYGRTREIRCLLSAHCDRHPSAGLYRSTHGAWRYKCHGCGANLSIVELYATMTGQDDAITLGGPTARAWLLRLWHATGVIPATLQAPDTPSGTSGIAQVVAGGFALLAALRAADGPAADPLPFTPSFAAAWCGLSEGRARVGVEELRELGWLRPIGPSHPKIGYLYEPPDS